MKNTKKIGEKNKGKHCFPFIEEDLRNLFETVSELFGNLRFASSNVSNFLEGEWKSLEDISKRFEEIGRWWKSLESCRRKWNKKFWHFRCFEKRMMKKASEITV